MLTALIPTVISIVASTSAGVAVDSAVKMLVPVGIKALPAFGIKIGTAIVGGVIGLRVGNYVETNVKEVMDIVKNTGTQEAITVQEDH